MISTWPGNSPAAASDWFYFDRGLVLAPDEITIKADTFGEAVALGGSETLDALSMVYKFLRRLGSQGVLHERVGTLLEDGPLTLEIIEQLLRLILRHVADKLRQVIVLGHWLPADEAVLGPQVIDASLLLDVQK